LENHSPFATGDTRMTRILSLFAVLTALTACNTIAGAGQDLTATGTAITTQTRAVQSDL
jgi:predicted small secreted protein